MLLCCLAESYSTTRGLLATMNDFELSAVSYRANPTNRYFRELSEKKPHNDDRASLTEITREVASKANFTGPALGHLVRALVQEDRMVEAHYFCERWIENNPTEHEAHRLAVLIACQRSDLISAHAAFQALQRTDADPGILWALETIILLAFSEGHDSATTARRALAASPNDPLVLMAACEAAYRTATRSDDTRLLIELFTIAPELAEERDRWNIARTMLRQHLVDVLRSRLRRVT